MNPGFAFQEIILIQISDIEIVRPVIQVHTEVFTGILESQFVHKVHPFCLRDGNTFDIRLFD